MIDQFQNVTDEQLAQRAAADDWASFDELVRRYEARIYRFAFNSCNHTTDARELTQETFISVYQNLKKFDPALSFTTWLFTIARRKCIDRSRRPRREFQNEIPETPDVNDPVTLIGKRESANDLWQTARRVLSDMQFQTLWLHYVEDLSVRDVARVMRRTTPHVKVLLFRARRLLAREIERPSTDIENSPRGPFVPFTPTVASPGSPTPNQL